MAAGVAAVAAVPLGLTLLRSDGEGGASPGGGLVASGPPAPSVQRERRPVEDAGGAPWVGRGASSSPEAARRADLPALLGELAALRGGEPSPARNRERAEVLRRIGLVEGPDAAAALLTLVREGEDPVERLGAVNVLWERGEAETVEALAVASADPLLVAKVEALRRVRGP